MLQDLRFAFRLIAKERWFSAAAIVALALGIGIGVNATGFTLVSGGHPVSRLRGSVAAVHPHDRAGESIQSPAARLRPSQSGREPRRSRSC